MSRSITTPVTAARLLLISSLPLALAYPQMIPPFELLNATSDAVPVSTAAVIPEETPIYNNSDPSITYDYFTASPTPSSSSTIDFHGSSTTDSAPEATATVISAPGMTSPLDPIFLPSPVYPFPTTKTPTVTVSTFLAVVQPLLDIIQKLLTSSSAPDVFGPYSTGPMKKRSTQAASVGLSDVKALVVALVKQVLAIINNSPAGSVTKGLPLDAATGAIDTVTNAAGGLPISAVTDTLGGATGGLPVVGGLTGGVGGLTGGLPVGAVTGTLGGVTGGLPVVGGLTGGIGSIASRALRRRQLSGLGSIVGAPKAIAPLVQSVTGAATGSTGNLPIVGSLPVNPGSIIGTATGAVSGNIGNLPGVGSLPVDPNALVNTATGTVASVAAGVPVVNNVIPGGLSITGNIPTSLDPSSLVNTVTGAATGLNVVDTLPVNPSTVVGTVTNVLPAPVANLVPSDITSTISTGSLAVVNSLLNAVIILLGGLDLNIIGGLAKRSTDVSLSSPTHAELHKREALYPVPVRTMRHGERKRQSANVDLGASSLDNAAHLGNGELMALLGPGGSLDPMGLMAQEDQSEDAYYASAPGGANSAEQYYPPMGDNVVPAFEGYSE
ncbi:hypothetical protein PTNB85_08336 [Pyrenophora teres f. teres]|uniref:Uncharacterized protein n=1 Tax=Pyrenophora teres f. teres TaxID=97479 RepID=A0A6S6WG85_9PLEO|nr:hypothetical protein PTNB85_08336 [Pyrenophora teres f. teres]KAE8841351.1 hypothetical protein HRS9122_05477 [Pyrenophora teres f. teres]CAE7202448.1 hypothetical protein PTTW11_09034 [Pyrenophora teres f. teres]